MLQKKFILQNTCLSEPNHNLKLVYILLKEQTDFKGIIQIYEAGFYGVVMSSQYLPCSRQQSE